MDSTRIGCRRREARKTNAEERSPSTGFAMRVSDTHIVAAPPAIPAADELTLGEVAQIIHQLQAVPSLDDVKAWISALLLRQRDYEAYRLFDQPKHGSNPIARSEYAGLLILRWTA